MASPQKENGFTPIAHEILEAIQQFKFTLNELKIILCVLRYTYGFNRKSHSMSLSFFENHTGLSRSRINKAIKNLVNNNVLIITKKGDEKTPNTLTHTPLFLRNLSLAVFTEREWLAFRKGRACS